MLDNDQFLLEKAYLSIAKALKPSSDQFEEPKNTDNEVEEIVSAGPVDEPAPGVDVEMIGDDVPDVEEPVEIERGSENEVATDAMLPSAISNGECSCEINDDVAEEEREEDEMAIDNLNSIRESIMKIAAFCATGGHLETWQQQKLAIAMDNLASVARSLH